MAAPCRLLGRVGAWWKGEGEGEGEGGGTGKGKERGVRGEGL